MKSVAVYCGHQFGTDPGFAKDAALVGELFAKNKIRLVFGGGNVGLMGAVASGAIKNGGDVVGVSTPHVIAKQEPLREGIDARIVDGVNERKQKMYELSDAFCILPGGIGTLNELTDIMTMQQVGETKKPIFFLNTGGYWGIFGRVLVHMQNNGFIANMKDYDITVAESPEDLIQLILKRKDLSAPTGSTDDLNL